jgi:hypothetical protein
MLKSRFVFISKWFLCYKIKRPLHRVNGGRQFTQKWRTPIYPKSFKLMIWIIHTLLKFLCLFALLGWFWSGSGGRIAATNSTPSGWPDRPWSKSGYIGQFFAGFWKHFNSDYLFYLFSFYSFMIIIPNTTLIQFLITFIIVVTFFTKFWSLLVAETR